MSTATSVCKFRTRARALASSLGSFHPLRASTACLYCKRGEAGEDWVGVVVVVVEVVVDGAIGEEEGVTGAGVAGVRVAVDVTEGVVVGGTGCVVGVTALLIVVLMAACLCVDRKRTCLHTPLSLLVVSATQATDIWQHAANVNSNVTNQSLHFCFHLSSTSNEFAVVCVLLAQ